ncbi:MAG: LytTR family transcriptional regulator [Carboxylicivirga sp.]|jgi:DNA-binding LytR/AlgR family response regulator|nr:LytTR family transcriptional regulator [Carboxylicivirga sp.]
MSAEVIKRNLTINPEFKKVINDVKPKYRSRLVVNRGYTFKVIAVSSIAFFRVSGIVLYANTFDGKEYIINSSMRALEEELDPNSFFRANRQYLVNIEIIVSFEPYFEGKLVVNSNIIRKEKIIISKNRVRDFKKWIDS